MSPLPPCTCGHGYLMHGSDDGVEGPCYAKECGCPFFRPSAAGQRGPRSVRVEHHPGPLR